MQRWFFLEPEENAKIRATIEAEQPPIIDTTNYAEKREWLYKVRVNDLRPGEIPCVTGNCKELGNWEVDKCVPLQEVHDPKAGTYWSKVLSIPKYETIEYRYCVVTFIAPCPHAVVRKWETNLVPRTIPKLIGESPSAKDEPEEFGYYDDSGRVDRGWAYRDTIIQFKLFNNPITVWQQKLIGRTLFVKVTPVVLMKNCHDQPQSPIIQNDIGTEESLSMDTEFTQPPIHTVTEVVSMKSEEENNFQLQGQFGVAYEKDDYLIFQISVVQPQNVAYLFDFYVYSSRASKESDPPYHVGFSYVLASSMKSEGHMVVPITSVKQRPLGEMKLEYLVITPLKEVHCNFKISYARHWKQSWAGLDVAHRGLGCNFVDTKRCAEVRENTIASLKTAISHGADFVEFDVQLSKDLIPIIYHDFYVMIAMKRKKHIEDTDMLELPVKDLTLEQLHLLKVYHLEEGKDKNPRFFDEHLEEHQPFPTLEHVLQVLDPHVGFNIEIKWTMQLQDGSFELNNPIDLNLYLDKILKVVLEHGGDRRIIFSSFNPDICTLIRLKQNKYPVMFLTQGQTVKYPPYADPRCLTIKAAVQFAVGMGLLGVTVHTEDILRDASQVKLALDAGLVIFCWGHDNNDPSTIKHLKQIGLHGVIYDKIDEFSDKEVKESIFLVEARESQKKQFLLIADLQNTPKKLVEGEEEETKPIEPCATPFIDVEKARLVLPNASTATSLDSLQDVQNSSQELEAKLFSAHLTDINNK
ncbi:glycerophosphocholine phosphodiesterase GPCPD1 isoform X2 [Chrysoperla carnea]|uniref:glycerophosphocholine phosphodiesterase GPCPD1 isoform X2 n=1 Tax=Chrysoperla carnea TaxID=189513 RepID=UPI001D0674F2|nr:glycerophosphocholine phosphodiesterase GPCPD1 isoform X2 [Chrysoperla carnea]